jgi:hypothetical protein
MKKWRKKNAIRIFNEIWNVEGISRKKKEKIQTTYNIIFIRRYVKEA